VNCHEARSALAFGPGEDPELERHLSGCPGCSRLAAADRRIDEARLALAAEIPWTVDVRDRVLREIARLGRTERDEVHAWQLGLAAATALLAIVALALLALHAQSDWGAAARTLDGLLHAAAGVASAIGAAALTALRAAMRLLAALRGAASPVAGIASRLEPLAVTGVGLCYAIMAGTILHVLARDLRRGARSHLEETRP